MTPPYAAMNPSVLGMFFFLFFWGGLCWRLEIGDGAGAGAGAGAGELAQGRCYNK